MANLVTDTEVKAMFNYTISFDTTALITTVHDYLAVALDGSSLTDTQKTDIELWLSAHAVCLVQEEGGVLERRSGWSIVRFNTMKQEGFLGTRYGQMAVSLDTSGILANAGKNPFLFRALGPT